MACRYEREAEMISKWLSLIGNRSESGCYSQLSKICVQEALNNNFDQVALTLDCLKFLLP